MAFWQQAQLVGCLIEQKNRPLEWDAGIQSLCAKCQKCFVKDASVSTAIPNRCAILISRVEQGKCACAQ